jgi:hypothetical protein
MYKLKPTYFVVHCPDKGYFIATKKKQICATSLPLFYRAANGDLPEPNRA